MGLAWDNYDELTETLSGKDTLHDTVGICYQNRVDVDHATAEEFSQAVSTDTGEKPAKRRRQFQAQEQTITPYKRRPSMSRFRYEIYTETTPTNFETAQKVNLIWVICCHMMNRTPMWRGWNSLVVKDTLPLQEIGYMENIELPPTRLDVVRETLIRSQKVALECGEEYSIVTYDLAIAKPALQIQDQESPMFDNVFICFGAFHICMTYFSCLGYILQSSGGADVLSTAGVLASGSVRGFIGGKHFNRCKRIHPLFALALQVLHFRQFLQTHGVLSDECIALLNAFSKAPSPESLSKLLETATIAALLDSYERFCDQTRHGQHGSTARFWILYIDLVHIYLLFDRASRTNDVPLYTYALGLMCPMFFAIHKPNYARWMTLYHLNLINMESTHPGISAAFAGGALSVRRTHNSFSRSAVDLTLEQTINRDAASRQGGIASFTQDVNARKRWTVTRSFRGAVVSSLLDMAGLTVTEDSAKELKPSRIEKDHSDIESIISEIESTLNPFTVHDEALYCLTTGKAVSESVRDDLLRCRDTGSGWHQDFINECKENPERFQKAIKRRKVKNFAQDAVKLKISTKDKQIREVKCTRDLFGRLLCLAVSQDIDLSSMLSYPLTPVPFSLCHITGEMNKTSKSVLMGKLEEFTTNNDLPQRTDVYIIDAMFFLRTLNLPATFGGIAMTVLKQACCNAKVIHIVCDSYPDGPSIKDSERELRGITQVPYKITGPSQKRPTDLGSAMQSSAFKRELLRFLKEEWSSQAYASTLDGHDLYFASEQDCILYTVVDGRLTTEKIHELECEHEEADTRMIFHANYCANVSQEAPVVVVRTIDTDVFVLLLYHARQINAILWMDAGINSKNTRRMINMTSLALVLTSSVCDALPSFHALTGCDYTASFIRKAKWKPFQILRNSTRFQSAMSQLGSSDLVDPDVSAVIEEYICAVYGMPKVVRVNEARLYLFRKLYAPKKNTNPLDKIKTSDPCCLPPCQIVLKQKLLRTNYITCMWKNARKEKPTEFLPIGHGWKMDKGRLTIVWYDGPSVPTNIEVEKYGETDDDLDEDLSDTATCNVSSDEEEDTDDEY